MRKLVTPPNGTAYTRRDALKLAAGTGAATFASGLLGPDGRALAATDTSLPPASSGKTGGTLRVGLAAGGVDDTLDALAPLTLADNARWMQLFETILINDPETLASNPNLATEFAPNKTGDAWTIRLKDGIEFHNGKTATIDDLIFTLNLSRTAAIGGVGPFFDKLIDWENIKKHDDLSATFQLNRPFSVLDSLFSQPGVVPLLPEGYEVHTAIGTGPWKLKSFDPGRQSVFVANENYHGGRPLMDELVMIDLTDDTARLNALLGGQIDLMVSVPPSMIPVIEGSKVANLMSVDAGFFYPIVMNCEQAPFDDVRVRQAMRLLADRQQLVDVALSGYGVVGNDLYGIHDQTYFNHDIPQREQDIDQAKFLLKQAGRLDDTFEIKAAPLAAGAREGCQVFAQQAQAAGIDVRARSIDASEWGANVLNWDFTNSFWPASNYPQFMTLLDSAMGPYCETHFGTSDPEFAAAADRFFDEVDLEKRVELGHEVQRLHHDRSGYIIYGHANTVDAAAADMTGYVKDSSGFNFGKFNFLKVARA